MPNYAGTRRGNLLPGAEARPPTPNLRHGFHSQQLSPRAVEVADAVMEAPWACEMDRIGAEEIGRLVSVVENLDARIEAATSATEARLRTLLDLRLRANNRLVHLLDRYGMPPAARASWAAQLASREALRRRLDEIEANGG